MLRKKENKKMNVLLIILLLGLFSIVIQLPSIFFMIKKRKQLETERDRLNKEQPK